MYIDIFIDRAVLILLLLKKVQNENQNTCMNYYHDVFLEYALTIVFSSI